MDGIYIQTQASKEASSKLNEMFLHGGGGSVAKAIYTLVS